jgi:hypothetical protein
MLGSDINNVLKFKLKKLHKKSRKYKFIIASEECNVENNGDNKNNETNDTNNKIEIPTKEPSIFSTILDKLGFNVENVDNNKIEIPTKEPSIFSTIFNQFTSNNKFLDMIQNNKTKETKEPKEPKEPKETKETNARIPIFELYQFNIVNYPTTTTQENDENLHFTSIQNSEEECSTFAVQSNNKIQNDETLSLCDIITESKSNEIETKLPLLTLDNYETEFYKYLYNVHNILKPKYFNMTNLVDSTEYNRETIIPEEIITDLFNSIIDKYTVPKINIITATVDDKYIIIGDFHGSLHSFIRILFRLHRYNIIDLKTMKLNLNYHLIFLGDIIDRGMYSVEILTTLLLLLKVNTRVHLIAGNHEASYPSINNRDGFLTEMKFKYGDDILYKKFNELFIKLPVALLIHEPTNNQTIWASHGCFNASGLYDYQLKDKDYNKDKEIPILTTNHDLINSILWSDIDYVSDRFRNAGAYYNKNTREQFRKFMKENRITGVIRGHQDNYSNSIIYYHNHDGNNYMKINELSNSNICDEKQVCYNSIVNNVDRVNGALARVVISVDAYTEEDAYQPVVTISTSTDMKRSLYADSFGLLRFDIINIKDFSTSLTKQIKIPL